MCACTCVRVRACMCVRVCVPEAPTPPRTRSSRAITHALPAPASLPPPPCSHAQQLSAQVGYNKWQLGGDKPALARAEGMPSVDGSEWWRVALEVPQEAYEVRAVGGMIGRLVGCELLLLGCVCVCACVCVCFCACVRV